MTATATATSNKLNFTAKLSSLKSGLRPAIEVATKGALKDCKDTNHITLEAADGQLTAYAYGGRLGCTVSISNLTDQDLGYTCDTEGKITVNAVDLMKNLDSFPESETVAIISTGNELKIQKAGDSEEVQALPLLNDEVVPPPFATSFDKELTVPRGLFLEGIKQTFWAVGFEDHKEQYLYWRLIAEKGAANFAAGTGGRFARWDTWALNNSSFLGSADTTQFFFHKDQTPALQSIIGALSSDDVIIRQATRKGDTPDQIVFEAGDVKIIFVGFNPNIKWPNIDKNIKEKKPYEIETKVSDWEYATKGLLATFSEEIKREHDSHESDIEAKLDKGFILLTSRTGLRAQRKVPIIDIKQRGDVADGLEFHCSTPYIGEIFSKNPKGSNVFIQHHEDTARPVFIVGSKNTNDAAGFESQLTVFFASMKS